MAYTGSNLTPSTASGTVKSVTVDGVSIADTGTATDPSLKATGSFPQGFLVDLAGNAADTIDGGFAVAYKTGGLTRFAGLIRKAAGMFYFRKDLAGVGDATDVTAGSRASVDLDIPDVYTQGVPADHGLLEWTFPPVNISGSSGASLASGVGTGARVRIRKGGTINTVTLNCTTAGVGLTNSYVAVYSLAGALLSQSADQSTAFSSTGSKAVALGTPVVVKPGDSLLVVVLTTVATTAPIFGRGSSVTSAVNLGLGSTLGSSFYNFFTFGTALTSPPSNITGANSSGNSLWVGLS